MIEMKKTIIPECLLNLKSITTDFSCNILLSKNLKQFTSCLTGHYRARSLKKTSGSEICFIVNCSITSLLDLEETPQLSGDGSRFKLLEGEKFMNQFT